MGFNWKPEDLSPTDNDKVAHRGNQESNKPFRDEINVEPVDGYFAKPIPNTLFEDSISDEETHYSQDRIIESARDENVPINNRYVATSILLFLSVLLLLIISYRTFYYLSLETSLVTLIQNLLGLIPEISIFTSIISTLMGIRAILKSRAVFPWIALSALSLCLSFISLAISNYPI